MKAIALTGNDAYRIYERYKKLLEAGRNKGYELIRLDNREKFNIHIGNHSMLTFKRLFIVKDMECINVDAINNDESSDVLILSAENGRSAKELKSINNIKIEKYDIPDTIFKTIDSIYPGNYRFYWSSITKLLEKYPMEYLFSVYVFRLRELALFEKDNKILGYPSWRLNIISKQYKKYLDKGIDIPKMIDDMAKIDVESKTSNKIFSELLDLYFLTSLE